MKNRKSVILHPPTKNCQFLLSCTSPCELCRIVHSDTRKVCREVFNDLTSIEWFKFSQLTPQNMLRTETNIMWTRVQEQECEECTITKSQTVLLDILKLSPCFFATPMFLLVPPYDIAINRQPPTASETGEAKYTDP